MTDGLSASDIALLNGNGRNNGDGFGDGNGWWIILFFLCMFGWGGRGFGGFGGNGSNCATQADVREAVDQQTLISKLDQQTYGLADTFTALNNTLNNNFRGIDNAICTLGYQNQQGFNNVSAQLASCCCDVQRAIDGVNYNLATQSCDTRNTIQNTTRDIIDNQNCNTRSILDFLVNSRMQDLQAENQSLKLSASQERQNNVLRAAMDANTAEIIRRTGNECPVPAYVVPNPNCCYNPFGFGYNNGYGTVGCGCGCS